MGDSSDPMPLLKYIRMFEASRNESYDAGELGGGAGGAIRHAQPFVESLRVQKVARGIVFGWMIN